MGEPREAITYTFPVAATVVLNGGCYEDPPTESEVHAAVAYALDGLSVEAKFHSYAVQVNVGAAESSSRGLVP